MKHSLLTTIIVTTLLGFTTPGSAQNLRLTLDGGASRSLGDNFDEFNWGYSLGTSLFTNITENLYFGGRLAYNRWGPDEAEFLDRIDPFDIVDSAEVQGSAVIVEVVPALRLMSNYTGPFNFFVHSGAGLYIMNTEITVNGADENGDTFQEVFGDDTRYRFGLQLGTGVIIGSLRFFSIEVYPMFHLIFDDPDVFTYLSFNAGIGIGL